MPNSLVQVAFHDAQVVCVMHDGKPFVALRPLCDALEIDWATQRRAIKNDPVLASTVGDLPTVGADGKARSMLCLPLDYLHGWLFKIDAGRYQPGDPRRDRIIAYQRECYRVLAEYFLGGGARMDEQVRSKLALDASLLRYWMKNHGYYDADGARQLVDYAFDPRAAFDSASLNPPDIRNNPWEQVPPPSPLLTAGAVAMRRNRLADAKSLPLLGNGRRF